MALKNYLLYHKIGWTIPFRVFGVLFEPQLRAPMWTLIIFSVIPNFFDKRDLQGWETLNTEGKYVIWSYLKNIVLLHVKGKLLKFNITDIPSPTVRE